MAATCKHGCVWLNGRWETVLGCPEHGHQLHLNPRVVDIPDEGTVTAEGFGVKAGRVETRLERDVVAHYTTGEIETIDFIFDKLGYDGGLAYILGNLIKYSSRANHKGQRRSDLVKIRNYSTIALQFMDKYGELE